ncbi:hypothetical protein GGS26DRAFT_334895 [Hypomontagnella submonticulosa]|nr:hypothetical protein GGS26DRAFT_334895 [Hypomontagnella submonticulosa]
MSSAPFLFLSPAFPSELLSYILNHHIYPTTLIICSSRVEFLAALADDVRQDTTHSKEPVFVENDVETSLAATEPGAASTTGKHTPREHRLLSSPLYQVAISRHIRVVYVPTVTHLRSYLSVFSPDDSKIPAPPVLFNASGKKPPCIVLYGFLQIHRDTSEWSAQGLGNSASALVELGHRLSWETTIIEPQRRNLVFSLNGILKETIPFLSGGSRRPGPDSEEGGWAGRTVEVGRVMKRWFRFQQGEWEENPHEDKDETPGNEA